MQPTQVAGLEFLYDLLGVEHGSWERPADAESLVYLPGRLDPQGAVKLNPEVKAAFEHIIAFHNACKWTLPRLDASNIADFLHHYDWFLRRYDAEYREKIACYS